ncbi:hypothetical protein DFH06DRAFT_1118254 [Mycena polygramma]|nr:hypothetical protein DFH06DRAFT_1118254 [Mycena polygramma]
MYDTALEQTRTNVLRSESRQYIGSVGVQVAQRLLVILPLELASIRGARHGVSASPAVLHDLWDTLERLVEQQALEIPQTNMNMRAALAMNVHEPLNGILNQVSCDRRRDLIRIRNLKRALELANVVADSR